MPLLFYLLLIVLIRVGANIAAQKRMPKTEPLCATCSFAHMQHAMGGKCAIFCTFSGGIRPITIDVMYAPTSVTVRCVTISFALPPIESETAA